jgi:hypothetical protein
MEKATVQMGSANCASLVGPAKGSWPTWPFGKRPKSRGARSPSTPVALPAGDKGSWEEWSEIGDKGSRFGALDGEVLARVVGRRRRKSVEEETSGGGGCRWMLASGCYQVGEDPRTVRVLVEAVEWPEEVGRCR